MSKKVKVAIIGTGFIAQDCHIPGYLSIPDQCEIVAICDIKPDAIAKTQTRYDLPRAVSDYRELLDDKDIDAVSICTPNAVHHQPTIDFLAAGKHVLCEKPLSLNGEQSRQMCKAARDAKKILQVGLQQRFAGYAAYARQFIENGNMGDIYYARAKALRRRGVPTWGVFTDKKQQGGGPLIDIGVHILDLTLFLMGYPKPVEASGKTWDMLGKNPKLMNFWGDYDRKTFTVEDFAVAMIRFENDAVVTLESSFMANMEGDPFETQLFGTKAGCLVQGWGPDRVTFYKEIDQQLFELRPQNVPVVTAPHTAEIHRFIEAIRSKKPTPVPGEQGWTLNAIFDAIYKSSETGKQEQVLLDF